MRKNGGLRTCDVGGLLAEVTTTFPASCKRRGGAAGVMPDGRSGSAGEEKGWGLGGSGV